MPYGDEKHKLIYDELVNILGVDNVSDDPALATAYTSDWTTFSSELKPEFVVLPGNTEDVQNIIKLANRLKFPYSITSTGLCMSTCNAVEGYPHWCFIDPKRMTHLEIDEENMMAVVEPYVTIAQLQAEIMKRGLFHGVTGASSQGSALATNVFAGGHWTSWKTGVGRNLLALEWVLPNGDILRTGSLAIPGAGYYWGVGPGPDLRGLQKGNQNHQGSLGVVTKVGIKLDPWPGPGVIPTEGVQPEKTSILPPERFKTFYFSHPSIEQCVGAMKELARAQIGEVVVNFAPWDLMFWVAKSREEYWERWESKEWQNLTHNKHLLLVSIWGNASEKQVEYEEKVLKQIIEETGGEMLPDEFFQYFQSLTTNFVRDTHRCRYMRIGGCLQVVAEGGDSIEDMLIAMKEASKIRTKHTPPLTDMGPQHKAWFNDVGYIAYFEIDGITDKTEEAAQVGGEIAEEVLNEAMEDSRFNFECAGDITTVGPSFSNVHLLLGKIRLKRLSTRII